MFHVLKFLTTSFFSHSPEFFDLPVTSTKINCAPKFLMTFFSHSLEIYRFHPCFRPLQLQSYNYNCTIHLLQLQTTFYNCRNCDHLLVKICPGYMHLRQKTSCWNQLTSGSGFHAVAFLKHIL